MERIPEFWDASAPGPSAEPAEREVCASAALSLLPAATRTRMPDFNVQPAALVIAPEPQELPLAAPPPQAAEREMIPVVALTPVSLSQLRMPLLPITAAESIGIAAPFDETLPALSAEIAEREVVPAAFLNALSSIRLTPFEATALQPDAGAAEAPPACDLTMSQAAAEAAPAAVTLAASLEPAGSLAMPSFGLAATHDMDLPAPYDVAMPGPMAEVAAREIRPAAASEISRIQHVDVILPAFQVAAAGSLDPAVPLDRPLAGASAEPVERELYSSCDPQFAASTPQLRLPRIEMGTIEAPAPAPEQVPAEAEIAPSLCSDWMPVPAQPAECWLAAAAALDPILPFMTALPRLDGARVMETYVSSSDKWMRPQLSQPAVVSVWPHCSGATAFRLLLPQIGSLHLLEDDAAPAEKVLQTPAAQITVPAATSRAVPLAGFRQVEVGCERAIGIRTEGADWCTPEVDLAMPNFMLRVIPQLAEPAPAPAPKPQVPQERIVVKLPSQRSVPAWAVRIAACLILGVSLWLAGRMVSGRRIVLPANAPVSASAGQPPAQAPRGMVASVRQAISRRAAAEVGDSLRGGMSAWGSAEKSYAPGWSRDPAGFVRPGQMALFRPTMEYTDYHLEFFGQVEKKSMSWAVRARDNQNYYAMKVNTLTAGLRPVISMSHYPVLGGKPGHRVEVPLNVMVHQNTPYHIAVDVAGNRFTASIEGQVVDSWVDEAPASGAVGFFSDAGERARLYWIKVTKNQDFLGRICAYLAGGSGDSATSSAELWNPEAPGDAPEPARPRPNHDVILAAAQCQRTNYWRRQVWNL